MSPIARLYKAFDPYGLLQAGDPVYVDCEEVRGDRNVERGLGNKILRADRSIYQLYSGHRGAGKSTELLRLQKHLKDKGCRVVYFAADGDDINPEDTEYKDILVACTRILVRFVSSRVFRS